VGLGFEINLYTEKLIGIYCIKCILTKKVYIGSSSNIYMRFRDHKSKLNNNKHANGYLQNSWNKYGENNFKFSIIELCDKNNLLFKENFYIEKNNSLNGRKGFNLVTAERKDDLYCNKDYLKKLSLSKIGKIPKNMEYCRNKQKRAVLEYDNNTLIKEYSSCKEAGKILKINYKKINNVLRGVIKKTKEYPNKTWVYKDKNPTRRVKNYHSGWNKGRHKKVLQYDYNGNLLNIFNSIEDCTKKLKISKNTIINNCSNKTKKCNKLKCRFKYE
jgi:hypothetical protein